MGKIDMSKNNLFLLVFLFFGFLIVFRFCFFVHTDSKNNLRSDPIIVALGSEPRSLDPRQASDANSMRIASLLFRSFVRIGPKQQILPSLAQKWHYHNQVYTFYIPRIFQFSNGRKLAKEDILFSFKEYQSDKNPFSTAFKIIQSVDVMVETKHFVVTIRLKKPSAKFLTADLPVLKILPKKETQKAGSNFYKNPIGTGPFKLKSQSSRQIILTSSSLPRKTVIFKIIRDELTRFQKILNKEIDVAQSELTPEKIHYFLNKKDQFHVFQTPGRSVDYLLLNFKHSCLKQKSFRQALAVSIDRLSIIQHKLKNFAHLSIGLLNPNNFFFNSQIPSFSYQPDQAQHILSSLKKCQKTPLIIKSSNTQSAIHHARMIAGYWRKVGLKVTTQSSEWGSFYADLNYGKFQVALLRWVGVQDPDIYRLALHSKEHPPIGRNRGFYSNPKLDSLLNHGLSIMNLQKRQNIYNQIQKIVAEDIAFIPLWHNQQIAIVKKSIKNYTLSQKGDFHYLTTIQKIQTLKSTNTK